MTTYVLREYTSTAPSTTLSMSQCLLHMRLQKACVCYYSLICAPCNVCWRWYAGELRGAWRCIYIYVQVVDVLTLGERICWSPCSEAAVPQAGGGIPMVPTRAAPASGGNIPTTGTYLALVSGLEIGRNSWSANDQLACDMFVDFVTGTVLMTYSSHTGI